MPTMLRQKGTGDLYVYSDIMAKRDDMEVLDEPDLSAVEEPAPAPKPKPPRRKAAPKVAAPEPEAEVAPEPEPAPKPRITDMFGDEE